jgi:hypothetical protein
VIEHVQSLNYGGDEDSFPVDAWRLQVTLVNMLPRLIKLQEALGIGPPVTLMLTIMHVLNRKLRVSPGLMDRAMSDHVIDRPELLLPEVVLTERGESPTALFKPVFDALWNAAGLEGCAFYRRGQWDIDASWLDGPQ